MSRSINSNCKIQNNESYIYYYLVAGLEAIACLLFLLWVSGHVMQISETFHEFLRLLKCL